MKRVESGFSLTVFERQNANSRRLAEYLHLYASHLAREHRTRTNELIQFLRKPPDDRRIMCFGLDHDGSPVGFAVMMVYAEKALAIVDHLVVAPNSRGHGAFFSFCELIARYLEQQRLQLEHVLAEIVIDNDVTTASIRPAMIIRLMRLIGFKVARVQYWAPDPSIVSEKHRCRAALLIASQPDRGELSIAHFREIISLLYLKHYENWYRATMNDAEFQSYSAAASEVRQEIEQRASRERRVILNGVRDQDMKFVIDASPATDVTSVLYILLILIPAAVGAAVAFKQELLIAAIAAGAALVIVSACLLSGRLRRVLLKTFRLTE